MNKECMPPEWFVYLLICSDSSFYCGVTTDVYKRFGEHNFSDKGAKYTRGRRPVHLVWFERCLSKKDAYQKEYKIKKMKRSKKHEIILRGTYAKGD